MIVSIRDLKHVLDTLSSSREIGIDTETTGLRPFHGDRIFSLILSPLGIQKFYFNFWDKYENVPERYVLQKESVLPSLQKAVFSNPDIIWYAHNAKYDLHMMANEGCSLKGHVHCTKSIGRVVYNEHNNYDLSASLARIGMAKDDTVDKYIEDNGCYERVKHEHKAQREKNKFYYKVPFNIIVPYGLADADGTLSLGLHQRAEIAKMDEETPEGLPQIGAIYENEVALTKVVFRMEQNGCRIDPNYCLEASAFEGVKMELSQKEIEDVSGLPFKNSAKCLSKVFAGHEHEFTHGEPSEKTGRRELSFDADALKKITHPLVGALLRYREAKNRLQFYQGFLYHRDEHDLVHPSFNPDVARHGRFSSSNPNFQNLKKDDVEDLSDGVSELDFFVRRAVIPREGNVLLMPDYSNFEYRMALEYACRFAGRMVPLAQKVLDGMDFHDATIELCKLKGYDIARKKAKIANFLTLYAGGPRVLAADIGCSLEEAQEIFNAIRDACPELQKALRALEQIAYRRGWIFNWMGRRCHFPNKRFTYKAGNYAISGGCADVNKIALVSIQNELDYRKSKAKLICTIHDENVVDCPRPEAQEVSQIMVDCMESAFPYEYVPMKADMSWSDRSLADKIKGYP